MIRARQGFEYSLVFSNTWVSHPIKKDFTVDLSSIEGRAR